MKRVFLIPDFASSEENKKLTDDIFLETASIYSAWHISEQRPIFLFKFAVKLISENGCDVLFQEIGEDAYIRLEQIEWREQIRNSDKSIRQNYIQNGDSLWIDTNLYSKTDSCTLIFNERSELSIIVTG